MENRERKKDILKKCAATAVFWLLLWMILGRVYQVLSWKDGSGEYLTPVETFYGLEENVVEVLFLGSSHSYCSVIPAKLWEDYGIAGYSLAISGQDLAASYYWLKEALKTQKPKVVCLEMYGAMFHGYGVVGNLYRNTLPYPISVDYLQMVRALIDEESGSIQTEEGFVSNEDRGSFMAKWSIIHTRYKELQRQDFTGPDTSYIGFNIQADSLMSQPVNWASDGQKLYEGNETMPMEEEEWLRKIIELTKEKGVNLCLYLAPTSVSAKNQMRANYVEELARGEGIPFLNFIDLRNEIGIDTQQDFWDWGHLNYSGAEKVTAALGKFISQNYAVKDHRSDAGYELWKKDAETREHELNNIKLQQSGDIQYILDYAVYASDYTILLATNGNYFVETDYLAELMKPLGISEEFANGGGAWIIEDGQVTWKAVSDTGEWYLNKGGADIVLSRQGGSGCIYVNQLSGVRTLDGINIVFYDKILNSVVCTVGFSAPEGYACVK